MKHVSPDTGEVDKQIRLLTEDAVASRFAQIYESQLLYCHDHGSWFEWTGSIWKKNATKLAFHFARTLARDLAAQSNDATKLVAGKASFAGAVEKLAQADQCLAVTSECWDTDPMLLGTPNGTVDLRTGLLRSSDFAERITKSAAVAPAGAAEHPQWTQFLGETFNDAGLIEFMQRWSGYCLTGLTREHALVFGYGPGGNGKSVFLNVLSGIMADYAVTASMDVFTASRSDRHPTDLAMMRGARLVTASETEEGHAWAEAKIKSLTGGDKVSARFMRENFFTFVPAFKLMIVGNHKPTLQKVDDAMRRRFNIVPFIRKPVVVDRTLEDKLKAEWPAILRWMIQGCLDWQKNGLTPPNSVREATENYFADQSDTLAEWLGECCHVEKSDPHLAEATEDLFASWCAFNRRCNDQPGSKRKFSERLEAQGFTRKEKISSSTGVRTRGFTGLCLR